MVVHTRNRPVGTFDMKQKHSQLTFEVLHNVKELVVNFGLFGELGFDRIEVTQRVADIERPVAR